MKKDVMSYYKIGNLRTVASQSISTAAQPSSSGIDLMAEGDKGLHEWVREGFIIVAVTSVGTGGTLDLIFQDSHDGSTWDTDFATIEQITAAGLYVVPLKDFNRKLRISAAVATDAVIWGAIFIGKSPARGPVKQADATELDITYGTGR